MLDYKKYEIQHLGSTTNENTARSDTNLNENTCPDQITWREWMDLADYTLINDMPTETVINPYLLLNILASLERFLMPNVRDGSESILYLRDKNKEIKAYCAQNWISPMISFLRESSVRVPINDDFIPNNKIMSVESVYKMEGFKNPEALVLIPGFEDSFFEGLESLFNKVTEGNKAPLFFMFSENDSKCLIPLNVRLSIFALMLQMYDIDGACIVDSSTSDSIVDFPVI